MPNPNVDQGTLNRVRGSVMFPLFPALNIVAPNLGKKAISVSREGKAVDQLENLTGTSTSPAPFQMVKMTIVILKSQSFAAAWQLQEQQQCVLGPATVRLDSAVMMPYQYLNVAIENIEALKSDGMENEYPIILSGYYQINNSLFD